MVLASVNSWKGDGDEMTRWKGEMTETVCDGMVKRLSLTLLPCRTEVHEGSDVWTELDDRWSVSKVPLNIRVLHIQ